MHQTPLHLQTPLLESRALSLAAQRTVWLKMEALQPPGSFKIRGIGHACQIHAQRGAKRFVSSSGGNAGMAVAYAGRVMDIPVTVVVPQTTTARAQELLRLEDADVIVHGASWQEANELALSMVGPDDAFLHPFDDPLLWAGHASMVDEVARAGVVPDAVVLSVGGWWPDVGCGRGHGAQWLGAGAHHCGGDGWRRIAARGHAGRAHGGAGRHHQHCQFVGCQTRVRTSPPVDAKAPGAECADIRRECAGGV